MNCDFIFTTKQLRNKVEEDELEMNNRGYFLIESYYDEKLKNIALKYLKLREESYEYCWPTDRKVKVLLYDIND